MNHVDLFSGIGGFALACRWAGLETIVFCEKDPFCQQVLNKHWPNVPIIDDIAKFKGEAVKVSIDLLTAGFPCQPFSVAGRKRGKYDERYLWPDTIRVIREVRPHWCILENVPGIIPHLDPILTDLEECGYAYAAFLIPAASVGAPHKRERLWIIAHTNGIRCENGCDHWETRYLQTDIDRYLSAVQQEWSQFQPISWPTFSVQEWLTSNTTSIGCNSLSLDHQENELSKECEQVSLSITDTNSIGSDQGAKDSQTIRSIEGQRRARSFEKTGSANGCDKSILGWQKDQPPIPGVDDGLPNGLDRNRALGNAIVPQIPYLLIKLITSLPNGSQ